MHIETALMILEIILGIWFALLVLELVIAIFRAIRRKLGGEEQPEPEPEGDGPDWEEPEEPARPEEPERPVQPNKKRPPRPALSLQQVTILAEDKAGGMRLSRLVQLTTAKSFRPVVQVKVSRKSLVGRKVRLKAELIDSQGAVRWAQEWSLELKMGVNYSLPPTWLEVDSSMEGEWQATLSLGGNPWAAIPFSATNRRLDQIDVVGKDGEMTKSKADFSDWSGASIDELLIS